MKEEEASRRRPNKGIGYSIINLLQAQQESIRQSEERDKEAIQAMMKFQADSERRHQEFMVSVLEKHGDIFSSKNKNII